ncbi:Clp protease ClpP [Bradyrhizobium sediminis]|uniref:ATP-dependent Clp protease proteolytic subunit n=1 Tax=Bradyrhizobium sediminis TaxID=2840469 RepID=A0A975NP61_9BRAD|nr:head maturation protease, ClpP-related [Bradyrhizobium sediminis]QWG18712.1 Clp protease ClpP [Bradyrhizobium sediminis]
MSKSWFSMRASGGPVGELQIFSDIGGGGVTSEAFHAELSRMRARGVKTLIISINSDGGDVPIGFHIFNMLERFPAKKIVRIDGLAASMASVIAMVGDEIIMPSNAMMMIHNPWGGVAGSVEQIESFGTALKTMRENIVGAYAKRTRLAVDQIRAMMDKETWLSAEEAVRLGFADRIEAPLKMAAMASLPDVSRFKNAPTRARGIAAIRADIFDKFNRKSETSPGGQRRYLTKDERWEYGDS